MSFKVVKAPENSKWYRLDNSAKIFPAASSVTTSNVFRLSCVLNGAVDPDLLARALKLTAPMFPVFGLRLRPGFFWYYFDINNGVPKVCHEDMYPCAPMSRKENDGFLYRVLYHEKRISLEIYHAITDGTGGLEFLQYLIERYFDLLHGRQLPKVDVNRNADALEDSYQKIYDSGKSISAFAEKAYQIKGTKLPFMVLKVIHGEFSTSKMLDYARSKGVTVTALIMAALQYSIYRAELKGKPSEYPIQVAMPVNLRKVFDEQSAFNFFGCVNIGMLFDSDNITFDEVLDRISQDMKRKLEKDYLLGKNAYNVRTEHMMIVRVVPLVLKNLVLHKAHRQGELASTTALSNLGSVTVPENIQDEIERFEFVLSPTEVHAVKCAVCSYGDKLVMTFSSAIAQTDVCKEFFRLMSGLGFEINVETNYSDELSGDSKRVLARQDELLKREDEQRSIAESLGDMPATPAPKTAPPTVLVEDDSGKRVEQEQDKRFAKELKSADKEKRRDEHKEEQRQRKSEKAAQKQKRRSEKRRAAAKRRYDKSVRRLEKMEQKYERKLQKKNRK